MNNIEFIKIKKKIKIGFFIFMTMFFLTECQSRTNDTDLSSNYEDHNSGKSGSHRHSEKSPHSNHKHKHKHHKHKHHHHHNKQKAGEGEGKICTKKKKDSGTDSNDLDDDDENTGGDGEDSKDINDEENSDNKLGERGDQTREDIDEIGENGDTNNLDNEKLDMDDETKIDSSMSQEVSKLGGEMPHRDQIERNDIFSKLKQLLTKIEDRKKIQTPDRENTIDTEMKSSVESIEEKIKHLCKNEQTDNANLDSLAGILQEFIERCEEFKVASTQSKYIDEVESYFITEFNERVKNDRSNLISFKNMYLKEIETFGKKLSDMLDKQAKGNLTQCTDETLSKWYGSSEHDTEYKKERFLLLWTCLETKKSKIKYSEFKESEMSEKAQLIVDKNILEDLLSIHGQDNNETITKIVNTDYNNILEPIYNELNAEGKFNDLKPVLKGTAVE